MFTMARIRATRGKGKDFFLNHLSCDDYYSEKERVVGVWKGDLAGELGLEGSEVGTKEFGLFQQNLNPLTGERLTQRTVTGGIRFYDIQCSAQKSVSVMSIFDDRLVEAHREAVALGMRELERFAAVRLRKGENVHTQNHENTGRFVYAEFHHDASRALDPQLHTHNVVCNVTKDKEGNFKALENNEICSAIRYCGRVYQNELARRCRELGYEIEESRDFKGHLKGFEIAGVSETVLEKFSKRTRDIDEQIALKERKLGRELTAREKHEISVNTRSRKMLESDAATVRQYQLDELHFEERGALEKLAANARGCEGYAPSRSAADTVRGDISLGGILPELFENASVLKQDEILAEALTQNLGQHTLDEWKQALTETIELRNIGGEAHNPYLSPETVIEAEKYAVEIVEQERGKASPLNERFTPFMGQENRNAQAEIVRGLLNSPDRYMLLRGVAGSGKTSTLQELCRGIRDGGQKDITLLAPTNSAVDVLKSEGFGNAQTVASFIMDHGDIPHKSVVIVDEAGLNSLREGVALLQAAQGKNLRVLFVGDARQHSAVENGDFFRLLEKFSSIDKYSLTEIHRQQIAEYKAGIQDCADGRFGAAFERFEHLEYIHEAQSKYISLAAQKYLEFTENGRELSQTIAVAPTHDECDRLTTAIRLRLKLGETVDLPYVFRSAQWSKAKLGKIKSYELGQPVMFVRKLKDVANPGDMVTVDSIDGKYLHFSNGKQLHISKAGDFLAAGETRQIELKEGDVIQFKVNLRDRKIYNGNLARVTDSPGIVQLLNLNMQPVKDGLRELPQDFAGYDYGWVTTSHKSQGRTANNVIVAAQKLDQKAFYVACSRGRQNLALFCPDKDYLRDNLLRNSSDRLTVHEVLERQKHIPKIPAEPTKPHIDLEWITKNQEEWRQKYRTGKSEYEHKLADYQNFVDTSKTEIMALDDRLKTVQQEVSGRETWLERGKIFDWIKAPSIKREIASLQMEYAELDGQRNQLLDGLKKASAPRFEMQPEPPLRFPRRIVAWGKKLIRQVQPKFNGSDRLLLDYAQKDDFDSFKSFIKQIYPTDNLAVQRYAWQYSQSSEFKKLQNLQFEPQTEEQYKVFNRAKRALLWQLRFWRNGGYRRYRREHEEKVRKLHQAIGREEETFAKLKKRPDAVPDQDLWRNAFSFGNFSVIDQEYQQMIETARQTAHRQFIEDMRFDFVKESDLNPIEVPPQLTASEIEMWLLSRTNAGTLDALLDISCHRQQELLLEQQRRLEQIRAEQRRRDEQIRLEQQRRREQQLAEEKRRQEQIRAAEEARRRAEEAIKQAKQQEFKRFQKLKSTPTAAVDAALQERAFMAPSDLSGIYGRAIVGIRERMKREFASRMNFKHIDGFDLNPLPVPPKLREPEIEQWLLSRTDTKMLNKLLETSCERQRPQIEACERKLEQQRLEQERLANLPTPEQKKQLQKLVDYGCFWFVKPDITRQQAAEVIAQYAPDRRADESARKFVREKLEEYPDMLEHAPNISRLTWGQYMEVKDYLSVYEQELARERQREQERQRERERQREQERQAQARKKSRGMDL